MGRGCISEIPLENQALSAFPSLLSDFCPHGYEMALHLSAAAPRKEERRRVQSMGMNYLRDLFLASHWSKLCHMATLAARESGEQTILPWHIASQKKIIIS